jgi:predicted DNA-binding transcriptional regulator
MARLDDLMPELKNDTSDQKKPKNNELSMLTGKKRRAWLVDSNEDNSVTHEKGSIEHIYKPESPSRIAVVGAPLSKGAMNRVYKPDSLCFADLRSNPLQLFRYLYGLTQGAGDNYKTPRVKLREMMLHISISKDSARTALRFLLKQKFIERIEFQPGHLGWSRYQLNEKICNELEMAISKGSIQPFEMAKNKIIEPGMSLITDLLDPWEEVDTSPLESIGFNKKHLLQIKNKTSPDVAQESINHFSYSLKYNTKTKEYPNPVATLIAVLKRGEAWLEPNYQSPQELAQLKIIEVKKAEMERKRVIEEELFKMSFDEWQHDLSKEEINALAPDGRKKGDITPPAAKLGLYFKEQIWPEKRKEYNLK